MSIFKPQENELRICRLLQEHSNKTSLCFQCIVTGDLFTSSGNEDWAYDRYSAIEQLVNLYGTFLVKFDIHRASTRRMVDANHFYEAPMNCISIKASR